MRSWYRFPCAATVLLTLAALPALAQTTIPRPTSPYPGSSTTTGRGRQEPCWRQAGLSQQAQQQRRQIQQNTRSEMQSVCNDSSLSQQQKQQKIHQIREQSRQQVEALITPQQRQAIESCQQQRQGGGRGGKGMRSRGRGGEGPCGAMPSASGGGSAMEESASDEQ